MLLLKHPAAVINCVQSCKPARCNPSVDWLGLACKTTTGCWASVWSELTIIMSMSTNFSYFVDFLILVCPDNQNQPALYKIVHAFTLLWPNMAMS